MQQDCVTHLGCVSVLIGKDPQFILYVNPAGVKIVDYAKPQSFASSKLFLIPNSQTKCGTKFVDVFLIRIQGVTGGTDQTSGGCSLC